MRPASPPAIAAGFLFLGFALASGCSSEGGGAKFPAAIAARSTPPIDVGNFSLKPALETAD